MAVGGGRQMSVVEENGKGIILHHFQLNLLGWAERIVSSLMSNSCRFTEGFSSVMHLVFRTTIVEIWGLTHPYKTGL